MDAAIRASTPPAAAGEEPRDARLVRTILRSVGLRECEYDPHVVDRFVELARRYAGDVLGEARAYADHAGRASLEADDVNLAIRAKSAFSPGPPRREVEPPNNPDTPLLSFDESVVGCLILPA